MKATAKYLRQHSKEILNAVRRGEEIVITYRGQPTARLIPVKDTNRKSFADSAVFGMWEDCEETRDVQRHVDKLRQGRF